MSEPLVSSVSDTARWVAVYRAWESARPDALFHDPLADRLAGERGRAIAASLPPLTRRGWPMIARTRLIDDLVLACVAQGCDRVLNLGAGLDTRPYRLPLPAALSWIEADLPALIDEKEKLLARETPVCRLVRERVDLADPQARAVFLTRAVGPALRVLVMSEGFLGTLDNRVVRAVGRDLAARAPVRWWVLDLHGPMGAKLANAPLTFAPPNGVAFFETLGWRARDIRSIFRAAVDFHRAPWFLRPFALLPDPNPRKPGRARWSAVVRLERRRAKT